MSTQATDCGEAQNQEFVTIFIREIFNNGRDAFLLKVVLVKGQPQIIILKNYYNFRRSNGFPERVFYFLSSMLGIAFQQ